EAFDRPCGSCQCSRVTSCMGHLLDTWVAEFSQVGERLTSPKRKKNNGVQKYSWPCLLGHAVVIETGKCGRRRCNDRERHDKRQQPGVDRCISTRIEQSVS